MLRLCHLRVCLYGTVLSRRRSLCLRAGVASPFSWCACALFVACTALLASCAVCGCAARVACSLPAAALASAPVCPPALPAPSPRTIHPMSRPRSSFAHVATARIRCCRRLHHVSSDARTIRRVAPLPSPTMIRVRLPVRSLSRRASSAAWLCALRVIDEGCPSPHLYKCALFESQRSLGHQMLAHTTFCAACGGHSQPPRRRPRSKGCRLHALALFSRSALSFSFSGLRVAPARLQA